MTSSDHEPLTLTRPDGTRLFGIQAGEGPCVVLAHGYLLDHSLYTDLVPALVARGHRVVAYDQRGHGQSDVRVGDDAPTMAADCAAWIRTHGDAHGTTLVAHSMGAFLALHGCLQEPDLAASLRRLVLLGGNAGRVAEGSLPNRLQIPLLKTGLLPRLWRVRALGTGLIRGLFGEQADPDLVERTRQMVLGNDPRATLSVLRAMAEWDLYPRLRELRVPTRVVYGTADRTCPAWHSERLASEIPGAQLRALHGRGHMLPFEDPEAVLEAVA